MKKFSFDTEERIVSDANWGHVCYQCGELRAMVSTGGMWLNGHKTIYYVSVLNNNNEDIYQSEFGSLDEALGHINQRYANWDFVDLTEKKGACGSCTAH